MKQLTQEQAIHIFESGMWKDWTDEEVVRVQLFQNNLCIPFDRFHQAIEGVLHRPIWTHEFIERNSLIAEYSKEHETPTFEEVAKLLLAEETT